MRYWFRITVTSVGALAVLTSLASGKDAAKATVLRGRRARVAVEQALLPFIMQYRLINTIHFVADIRQSFTPITPGRPARLTMIGRYRFWADGDRYRIDWRVLKSNYQPSIQQIWTFNGRRYEVVSPGPNSLLYIRHHRLVGLFGPAQPSPLLAPIFGFCQRVTIHQPGNWLDYWRIRHQPKSVDELPSAIRIGKFVQLGPRHVMFMYCVRHERWPAVWPKKTSPPAYFHPGGRVWEAVTLNRRGGVWLPTRVFNPPVPTKAGPVGGLRYFYRKFLVGGRALYFSTKEESFSHGAWRTIMKMRPIRVGGRLDPTLFTINLARARGVFEHDRIINISRLPAAPARSQHFGSGGKPAGKQ